MTETTSSSDSDTSSQDSSGSSVSSDQNHTIIKTLRIISRNPTIEATIEHPKDPSVIASLVEAKELSRMRGDDDNVRLPTTSAGSQSTTSGSTSSSYKRYKFGLTNHFLTMPDAGDHQSAAKSVRAYQNELATHNQQKIGASGRSNGKKRGQTRQVKSAETRISKDGATNKSGNFHKESALHPLEPVTSQPTRSPPDDHRLVSESDDNCDLSVLAASLPDPNSLLSDEDDDEVAWSPHLERQTGAYNAHDTTSHLNLTQSSDGDSSSKALTKRIKGMTNKDTLMAPPMNRATGQHHHHRDLLPAGDAGLDAVRCNSKAKSASNEDDYYLSAGVAYLNSPVVGLTGASAAAGPNKNLNLNQQQHHDMSHNHPDDDDPLHHHHMKKKRKLNGDSEDCASNGLLVKFSSIMYATFLVILGCILHVSELKQKSRNSSDHIYTTIVASIGILWLIFLQSDLQRYKKYASKFILLETIFNDHHSNQQQQQQLQRRQRAGGPGSANDILMDLDPTSRSTSSSSASLVNDRMSMNTEVIFKKTAYKMYQHQAANNNKHHHNYLRNNQSMSASVSGEPPFDLSSSSASHHHHDHPQSTAHLGGAATPQLIPAYKFLHGKMGANFYLKCGMAAFCFGHVIHEGLRFGQQVYFFATNNLACRDSAALIAHLVTPLYSFYQLFMMFKYSNLVINRHKILARFGLMHIIGTCVTFWFRTILEEAFEDFVHKMDYFKSQNKPINHYLDPTSSLKRDPHQSVIIVDGEQGPQSIGNGLLDWLNTITASESSVSSNAAGPSFIGNLTTGALANQNNHLQQQPSDSLGGGGQNLTLAQSALLALMSSPLSATITPQIVRHLPDSYHCAQNTLLTTKSMNALPYLYPFTIEYNLLIAATFLSLYFNIGKVGAAAKGIRCYLTCCLPPSAGPQTTGSELMANNNLKQVPTPYLHSSGTSSFIGSSSNHHHQTTGLDLANEHKHNALHGSTTGSLKHLSHTPNHNHLHPHSHYQPSHYQHQQQAQFGEYKSNFVVNADCHAANKGLFLGFFVLLVTLVTIVIFFVTINKPTHLQLGIKINLIQEATLTSLILIVTLAGYRQIMRLTRNPFIRDKVTTDDVLMLIPLPFFFIHSLLSFRAETATLYTPHNHLTSSLLLSNQNQQQNQHQQQQQQKDTPNLNAAESAVRFLKLEAANQTVAWLDGGESANGGNSTSRRIAGTEGSAGINGRDVHQRRTTPMATTRTNQRTAGFLVAVPSGLVESTSRNRRQAEPKLQSSNSANNTTRRSGSGGSTTTTNSRPNATSVRISPTTTTGLQQQQQQQQTPPAQSKIDHFKLLTIILNLAVMVEVLVQTNFIIDGLRRCSESRYLRFKKPGRELITFAILLNITYWIVATFETKSVEQYKTEIDYYGPLPYMFISHTTLPVMLFYRYHSSVCLAEIWNRAYKPPKRR